MKVSKLSFGALGILACLFSTVFILSSCKPDLSERDFVLSQKRDNRLIGSWKYIYSSPEDNDILIKEYTSAGEIKRYNNGELFFLKYYFYTKDNILYELELGDGFKRSNWTREYEYRFSEDENMLYIKERDCSIEYKWQRVINSQQK